MKLVIMGMLFNFMTLVLLFGENYVTREIFYEFFFFIIKT